MNKSNKEPLSDMMNNKLGLSSIPSETINRGKVKVSSSSDTERGDLGINVISQAQKGKSTLSAAGSNVLGGSSETVLPQKQSLLKKKAETNAQQQEAQNSK